MGSLAEASGLTDEEVESAFSNEASRYSVAHKIRDHFIIGGNHESALACMSGVRHEEVLEILRVVLREPEERPNLRIYGKGLGDIEVTSETSASQSTSVEISA